MNLMRQRDDIKDAVAAGALTKGMADKALSSPVFQWWSDRGGRQNENGDLDEDCKEFIYSYLMDNIHVPAEGPDRPETWALWPKFTPYECFRISYMDVPVYEQWFVNDKEFVCFHCDDGFSHPQVKTWTIHHKAKDRIGYWLLSMWVNGEKWVMPRGDEWGGDDVEHEFHFKNKVTMKGAKRYFTDYAAQVTRMLGIFLFDIYGSGATVVKVGPKPDTTKSVQWRQAREHYLVLRRQQVEKLRESKGTVNDGDIVRSAHWRRAHLRRLSSHKFINKRGLLVPVKKAWVGPTEWQGHDGKVYTVVGMGNPLDPR